MSIIPPVQVISISPREAVLIGLAFGAYEESRVSFLSLLDLRLTPLCPPYLQHVDHVCVEETDVPDSSSWYGTDSYKDSGFMVIETDSELITYIREDDGRWFRDRGYKPGKLLYQQIDEQIRSVGAVVRDTKRDTDDFEKINEYVQQLVEHNNVRDSFSIGRTLGRAFAVCSNYDRTLMRLEDPFLDSPDRDLSNEECLLKVVQFKQDFDQNVEERTKKLDDSWSKLIAALEKEPAFIRCDLSKQLIKGEGTNLSSGGFAGLSDQGSFLNSLLTYRTNLCLIVGELLGALRAEHEEPNYFAEAQRTLPRMFHVSRTSGMSKIDGSLCLVEKCFHDDHLRAIIPPESIIQMICHAVEILSRELWEIDQKMGQFLEWKSKGGKDEKERKFARIAYCLYTAYRIDADHKPNIFQCNWDEAWFFYSGVRSLQTIAQSILKDRDNPRRTAK